MSSDLSSSVPADEPRSHSSRVSLQDFDAGALITAPVEVSLLTPFSFTHLRNDIIFCHELLHLTQPGHSMITETAGSSPARHTTQQIFSQCVNRRGHVGTSPPPTKGTCAGCHTGDFPKPSPPQRLPRCVSTVLPASSPAALLSGSHRGDILCTMLNRSPSGRDDTIIQATTAPPGPLPRSPASCSTVIVSAETCAETHLSPGASWSRDAGFAIVDTSGAGTGPFACVDVLRGEELRAPLLMAAAIPPVWSPAENVVAALVEGDVQLVRVVRAAEAFVLFTIHLAETIAKTPQRDRDAAVGCTRQPDASAFISDALGGGWTLDSDGSSAVTVLEAMMADMQKDTSAARRRGVHPTATASTTQCSVINTQPAPAVITQVAGQAVVASVLPVVPPPTAVGDDIAKRVLTTRVVDALPCGDLPYGATSAAWLDIGIGGEMAGTIVIALFGEIAPKAVANFQALCVGAIGDDVEPFAFDTFHPSSSAFVECIATAVSRNRSCIRERDTAPPSYANRPVFSVNSLGEGRCAAGHGYTGSRVHRVVRNFAIQGGDIIAGNGTGTTSIFGDTFPDEKKGLALPLFAGAVAMCSNGQDSNGCQWFIAPQACPPLDGKHVVIGAIVSGHSVVDRINNTPVHGDAPQVTVKILGSGLYDLEGGQSASSPAPPPVAPPFLQSPLPDAAPPTQQQQQQSTAVPPPPVRDDAFWNAPLPVRAARVWEENAQSAASQVFFFTKALTAGGAAAPDAAPRDAVRRPQQGPLASGGEASCGSLPTRREQWAARGAAARDARARNAGSRHVPPHPHRITRRRAPLHGGGVCTRAPGGPEGPAAGVEPAWSPCGRFIALVSTTYEGVPSYPLSSYSLATPYPAETSTRYAFPGGARPASYVVVVDTVRGSTFQLLLQSEHSRDPAANAAGGGTCAAYVVSTLLWAPHRAVLVVGTLSRFADELTISMYSFDDAFLRAAARSGVPDGSAPPDGTQSGVEGEALPDGGLLAGVPLISWHQPGGWLRGYSGDALVTASSDGGVEVYVLLPERGSGRYHVTRPTHIPRPDDIVKALHAPPPVEPAFLTHAPEFNVESLIGRCHRSGHIYVIASPADDPVSRWIMAVDPVSGTTETVFGSRNEMPGGDASAAAPPKPAPPDTRWFKAFRGAPPPPKQDVPPPPTDFAKRVADAARVCESVALTRASGVWSGQWSPHACEYVLVAYEGPACPWTVLWHVESGPVLMLDDGEVAESLTRLFTPPAERFTTFTTGASGLTMDARVMMPPDVAPAFTHVKGRASSTSSAAMLAAGCAPTARPTLVYFYGGPDMPTVTATHLINPDDGSILRSFFWNLVFTLNATIILLEPRGVGVREGARAAADAMARSLGARQSEEIVDVLQQMPATKVVDPSRLCLFGWSYGAYLALMTASTAAMRAVAVARPGTTPRPLVVPKGVISVAAVTDWAHYDAAYAERYLGDPSDAPGGYVTASVLSASRIASLAHCRTHEPPALLLCHGLADDNVHYAHTAFLTEALVSAGGLFEMGVYANRTHDVAGRYATPDLFRRMARFIAERVAGDCSVSAARDLADSGVY